MSLKQLEEAIKNISKAFEMLLRYSSKKNFILTAGRLHKLKEAFEKLEVEFDAFKKQLQDKRDSLIERLKKEPYPQTNIDSLILHAGIGWLDEVLGKEKHDESG